MAAALGALIMVLSSWRWLGWEWALLPPLGYVWFVLVKSTIAAYLRPRVPWLGRLGPDETTLLRSVALTFGVTAFLAYLYRGTDYLLAPGRQSADAIWLLFLFPIYPVSQLGKPGLTATITVVSAVLLFAAEVVPFGGVPAGTAADLAVQWLWLGSIVYVLHGLQRTVRERVANVPLLIDLLSGASELRALPSDETILSTLVSRIAAAYGYSHVNVFLREQDGSLRCVAASSVAGKALVAETFKVPLNMGIIGHVLSTGRAYRAPDTQLSAHYLPLAAFPDTRSEIALPICVRGHTVGVLDVQSTVVNPFQSLDEELLALVAEQIGKSLDNAALVRRLSTIINRVTFQVLTPGDLYPTLRAIATVGHEEMEADGAVLYARDPASDTFFGPIHDGTLEALPSPTRFTAPKGSLLVALLNSQETLHLHADVDAVGDPPEFRRAGFARRHGIRSRAILILRSAGDCIGVLFLNYRALRTFDPDDEAALGAFGRLAALAIAKAQLQEHRARVAGHILSRSVHENVKGRSFAVSELLAQVYENLPSGTPDPVRHEIEIAHEWVRTMQKDASFFGSTWFDPPGFDLKAMVEKMAHDFEAAYEVRVRVRFCGRDPAEVAPDQMERIHAILFEAINNAGRHARTLTRVDIVVEVSRDDLHLIVGDDGEGLDAARPRTGMGTRILKELAAEGRGTVTFDEPGLPGTRVHVTLPLEVMS